MDREELIRDCLATIAKREEECGTKFTKEEVVQMVKDELKLRLNKREFPSDFNCDLPPRATAITKELLASASDEEVFDTIHWYALRFCEQSGAGDFAHGLRSLPWGIRMEFHLAMLDGDVGNGGLPYFLQTHEEFVDETLVALRQLGATKRARLLENAIRIHRELVEASPDGQVPTYEEGGQLLSDYPDEMYELNHEYWALLPNSPGEPEIEPVWKSLLMLIREHPEEFLHDSNAETA